VWARQARVRHILGIIGWLARTSVAIALLLASIMLADYLLRNTPRAAQQRCDRENAAVVAVATRIYEANRWPDLTEELAVASPPECETYDCEALASIEPAHFVPDHDR
jgi:hypothetical protein